MRRACYDVGLIIEEDRGGLIGIGLGYDHCAEHEWGTKDINLQLGIGDGGTEGFDRTMVTKPEGVHFYTKGNEAFLFTDDIGRFGEHDGTLEGKLSYVLRNSGYIGPDHKALKRRYQDDGKAIVAFWDSHNFLVMVKGDEYVKMLSEVYDMFVAGKMTKHILRTTPFGGGGLVFVNIDGYTDQEKNDFIESDRSQDRLNKAVEKTGIKQRLEDAGCKYHALSPRWSDDNETEIAYWLNPRNQKENNFGWFTIHDLEEWTNGKGKIPK